MRLSVRATIALLVLGTLSCSDANLPTNTHTPAPQKSANGSSGSPNIVISQVYGAGGNSGATYTNDFVELFNRSGSTISLTGMSIQYASATGTGNFASNPVVVLSGSLAPGQYFLVKLAGGSTGVPLPTPDLSPTSAPNMSGTAGKVALVASTTGLACNGGSAPCNGSQLNQIVDLIGYGNANFFEGSGAASQPANNTMSLYRAAGGCQDTDDNKSDFAGATVAPRNKASELQACPGSLPVGPLDHVSLVSSATVMLGVPLQLVATPKDANGQVVGTATVGWVSADPSTATVDATGLVTGVSANPNPVAITATATDNGITKTATAQVTVVTPTINWIDVSSSADTFPVGFQTQLFVTARVASGGAIIPANFTFAAADPGIAAVTQVGTTSSAIITGVGASGTKPGITITATPTAGGNPYTFTSHPVLITAATWAPSTVYAVNDEFGDPSAVSASDPNSFLVQRPQYTISYNQSRGTPNWVSYELDARQMVAGQDRCNCFTADPLLPVAQQIFTSDYTNGGYDRGHMARSADRTFANGDNASTFYLTNIVPQMADLNQGVWAQFENTLADSVRLRPRAVYIITGPLYAGPLTFLKNEGKVAIPDATWKVAVIGPDPSGAPFTRASLNNWTDISQLTVYAVVMPNISGIRNDPWSKYLTTIDAIEAATGYDFLSLLPAAFQSVLEGTDKPPVARTGGPYSINEGSAVTFGGSTYPNGDTVQFSWAFGDGSTSTDESPTHTYANDGTFNVTLTITDPYGANTTSSTTVTAANVAPQLASVLDATILRGETYTTSSSFTDPGADTWSATVDYGDGSGVQSLTLNGKDFQLSHTYATAGTYSLVVNVSDDDVTSTETIAITVLSPVQGINALGDMVTNLPGLNDGQSNALGAMLNAAAAQTRQKNNPESGNILQAFINALNGLINGGQLDANAAQPLIDYAQRVITSL